MSEFAIEVLTAIFPSGDVGKVLTLTVICLFMLIIFGRLKLEWVAAATVHIYRWLRCKIRDRHHWVMRGQNIEEFHSGIVGQIQYCEICGKTRVW